MATARTLAALVLIACGHHYRPAVMPNFSEVPADRRYEVIESSLARPTSEQQPASEHGRTVETFASTAAAYLGMLFSRDDNASFGTQWIDVDTPKQQRAAPDTRDDKDKVAKPNDVPTDDAALVPWVHLTPP